MRLRQGGRRVDLVLGILLLVGVLTGITANTIGVNWPLDLIQIHAAAALAILLLTPWKFVVARRGLGRKRRPWSTKGLSLALAFFVLVTIGSGLLHSTGRVEFVGPLTLMQIHVGSAVGAVAVLVTHFLRHAVRPRRKDADRRAALRLAVLGGAAAVATAAWDTGAATDRRFTGSVPKPELEVTSWINDGIQQLDPASYRLRVGTAVLDLDAVLALPHETFDAVLDCTSGWYSHQQWQGVRLSSVLTAAGVTGAAGAASRSARRPVTPAGSAPPPWTSSGWPPTSAGSPSRTATASRPAWSPPAAAASGGSSG
jgi:hypothetical protein